MTVLDQKNRVARKEHECMFCGGIIKKGETYDWQKNISRDGDLYEWKSHLSCTDLVQEIGIRSWLNDDEGIDAEYFQECVIDEYITIYDCERSDDLPPFHKMLELVKQKHQVKD